MSTDAKPLTADEWAGICCALAARFPITIAQAEARGADQERARCLRIAAGYRDLYDTCAAKSEGEDLSYYEGLAAVAANIATQIEAGANHTAGREDEVRARITIRLLPEAEAIAAGEFASLAAGAGIAQIERALKRPQAGAPEGTDVD